MKHILFLVVMVMASCMGLVVAQKAFYRADSESLCFDKRVVSLSKFQHLDLAKAFEAIYQMAEAEGSIAELPQGFINCLEQIHSGDDRVRCCDLIEALKLVLDFLLTTRS